MVGKRVVVVGGGFTGLTAAYELSNAGADVTVIEADPHIGGLAAAFDVQGEKLDKFYHHWFTNDLDVMGLINDLGLEKNIEINPTNTGLYYANQFFKLSTPLDLLKFKPISLLNRIRLGLLALRARKVKNWKDLEGLTAQEWLKSLGGSEVYRVVWEPLLKGKFGPYAKKVSAVWFWNKLKLRGGSRGKGGEERLAYYKGGFIRLADALVERIKARNGVVKLNSAVNSVSKSEAGTWLIKHENGVEVADVVILTTALPLVSEMIEEWAPLDYVDSLKKINYIGNVCLVLELSQSLSSTYWLNVNDPTFPFVGIIEHTNFESPKTYGGRHIVYLSKYLPHTDEIYRMSKDEFQAYALPFIKKMFPKFDESWILDSHLWRERWSQPVVEKFYSSLIPAEDTPWQGLHICSMAQIYPEDRGTNYAIREGRRIGRKLSESIRLSNV